MEQGVRLLSNYIKPLKRPPKNPPSGKGKTVLGLRREALLNEWSAHAQEEHQWGERYGGAAVWELLHDCTVCVQHIEKLKESEEWT